MMVDKLKVGTLIIEISARAPERILNLLWNKGVKSRNIVRVDITTIRLEVDYGDYKEVEEAVKRCEGKIRILKKSGGIFLLKKLKKQISLVIGGVVFLIGLYILSTYVWAIEISTGNNLSPFEVRKELKALGVAPGLRKGSLNVYELEEKLQGVNENILWIRARIEGSTLKVIIEEKINPPANGEESNGDCVAKIGGEIKRVFVISGTSNIKPGDFVKEGDVLIKGVQGKEGGEYEVPAKGTVIANTFYEKEMEVQISGSKLEKTGKRDKDIYLSLLGRKIYLKKAINSFEYYDKIEDKNGLLNFATYFERAEEEVVIDKEEAIKNATDVLTESLLKSLSNDDKIADKNVYVEDVGEGKIRVKVTFVVEQDIAKGAK